MSRWIPLVLVGACCPPEPAKKVTHILSHRLAKRAHDASAAFCKYADTFIDEANSSPRCSACVLRGLPTRRHMRGSIRFLDRCGAASRLEGALRLRGGGSGPTAAAPSSKPARVKILPRGAGSGSARVSKTPAASGQVPLNNRPQSVPWRGLRVRGPATLTKQPANPVGVRSGSWLFSNSGRGVKLSANILAGHRVLSAVGACPPHDGVR